MSTKYLKQHIAKTMVGKKVVLDFWPVAKPPESNSLYFVLFQMIGVRRIEYHFGFANFTKEGGWETPDENLFVTQWTILPTPKILL